MKMKSIEKALKGVIIYEGIILATFIPPISKFVGSLNVIAQNTFAEFGNTANSMINIATRHTFGFSNLYFLALLLIAIGISILDIIFKSKESGGK